MIVVPPVVTTGVTTDGTELAALTCCILVSRSGRSLWRCSFPDSYILMMFLLLCCFFFVLGVIGLLGVVVVDVAAVLGCCISCVAAEERLHIAVVAAVDCFR